MKTIIRYLSPAEFKEFKKSLNMIQEFDATEKYGLTISVGDKSYIVICNDPSLSQAEKQIILWHEKGHALGYEDEENADVYALNNLNKEAQELLKTQWSFRHGHPFK
jgi:hypothetical protein